MAVVYLAPAGRARRRTLLVVVSLSIGVALIYLLRPDSPKSIPRLLPAAVPASILSADSRATAVNTGCDADCAVAKFIVPATNACSASIEELSAFGLRWLDAGAVRPRFDRFAWRQAARGTVTLTGFQAEFRNAAASYLPVEYDCDFDTAKLVVLEARARPRAMAPVAEAMPATR